MYLVFDIGGTQMRLALSRDGKTLDETVHLPTDPGPKGLLEFCQAAVRLSNGHKLAGIAGGLPGQIDYTGHIWQLPNMPGWKGQMVGSEMRRWLGIAPIIHNDAAVAGLGEVRRGAGMGATVAAYITISTGVNGARVVNGQIDTSDHGFEIGQQLITSKTGKLMTLEALISGSALAKKYGRPPVQLRADREVWHEEARYLALALHNLDLYWSPEVIILGGSMMHDIVLDELRREMAKLPQVFASPMRLELAKLGDEGGLYGALELLRA